MIITHVINTHGILTRVSKDGIYYYGEYDTFMLDDGIIHILGLNGDWIAIPEARLSSKNGVIV